MAVRIRANRKTIICAAKSPPLPGDCYLDDDVHYTLAVELDLLHWTGRADSGADLWGWSKKESIRSDLRWLASVAVIALIGGFCFYIGWDSARNLITWFLQTVK